MRITKKLRRKLHAELCMNDVLYEIHKRKMDQLNREAKRLIHDRKRINKVLLKVGKNVYQTLKILDIEMDENGTSIIVEDK